MNRATKPMAASSETRHSAASVVLVCFFASGASGLIYQVVWVRELVLIFGATTFAASTVLTAFMGGLALGSFYFGRRTTRVERPLRLYGLLELGIGIYGLLVPVIFAVLPGIYQPVWQSLHLSFFWLSLIRFALVALVLIVPTSLMGATLPVLASYYARGSANIGLRVGWLYALNTFGAVLGTALSGFVLIPGLGMRLTTVVAAGLNLVLGATALAVDRAAGAPSRPEPKTEPAPQAHKRPRKGVHRHGEAVSRTAIVVVLAAFAISGFVALSYEVIWSRVLALIIGSSVYAFSIMLTTFLVGLAIGAWLASRFVDRLKRPMLAFALVEIGIGVTSLAGAYLFNELPYVFILLYRWLAGSGFGLLLLARFVVASLVMILPTLLLGSLFPLVVRIAYGRKGQLGLAEESLGKTVGNAYAVNTVGAIAGAFMSGFALIPAIGLLGSLRFSVAMNFLIAGALVFVSPHARTKLAAGLTSAVLLVAVVLIEPPWDIAVMSSGVYRYAPAMSNMDRAQFNDYFRQGNQGEALYYKEGITATVVVQEQAGGRVLKVNGKPDASTGSDLPTQVLIGTLPLLIRERTSNVLVIGLGSGVTLGSIEQFPINQVTCVELEPAVIEASHYFNDVNNRPLQDPRLRLIANDGRNFIETTDELFDVIISEPSNPWLTGAASLFTLEYFKHGAERLKEDGVFSQWLQIYEMPPEDVKALVATFRAAFPYVTLFRGAGSDLMLLGSKQALQFNLKTIERHLTDQKIGTDHRRAGVNTAADLLSYFYFGPEGVAKFASGAPLNTDDNALIEFRAPRQVGVADQTIEANLKELLACAKEQGHPLSNGLSPELGPPLLTGIDPEHRSTAELLIDMALGAIKRDDARRAEQFVDYSLGLLQTARAYSVRGEISLARANPKAALESWEHALGLEPGHFYTLINLGKYYLQQQEAEKAAEYLDRAIRVDPDSARARHLRGLAFQAIGDVAGAVGEYRRALPDRNYVKGIKTFYLNFGTALASLGLYEEASQMLEEYTALVPGDFDGQYHLGAAYEIIAERTLDDLYTHRAIERLSRAVALKPTQAMPHYYLSKALRRLGRYDEAEAEFELYERYLAR